MTIEQKVKDLILKEHKTLKEFAKKTGIPYGTVDGILRRGFGNSNVENVFKICKTLGISADELANGRIIPIDKNIQHRTHLTEMNDIIIFTKKNIKDYDDLTIDGKPMSEDEIEILLDAFDIAVGIIKRNRERVKQ